jgi:hypothetical protein
MTIRLLLGLWLAHRSGTCPPTPEPVPSHLGSGSRVHCLFTTTNVETETLSLFPRPSLASERRGRPNARADVVKSKATAAGRRRPAGFPDAVNGLSEEP